MAIDTFTDICFIGLVIVLTATDQIPSHPGDIVVTIESYPHFIAAVASRDSISYQNLYYAAKIVQYNSVVSLRLSQVPENLVTSLNSSVLLMLLTKHRCM